MPLEKAAGTDIFFIPEVHFAQETPGLEDDEGWWYQVRSVIWCRECRKCGVRKEREGFEENEWTKARPAICTRETSLLGNDETGAETVLGPLNSLLGYVPS